MRLTNNNHFDLRKSSVLPTLKINEKLLFFFSCYKYISYLINWLLFLLLQKQTRIKFKNTTLLYIYTPCQDNSVSNSLFHVMNTFSFGLRSYFNFCNIEVCHADSLDTVIAKWKDLINVEKATIKGIAEE